MVWHVLFMCIDSERERQSTHREERERGRDRAIENEWAKEEKWKNNTLISVWFGILRTPNHLYPIASSISSDYNARRLRLRLIRSCMVSANFFLFAQTWPNIYFPLVLRICSGITDRIDMCCGAMSLPLYLGHDDVPRYLLSRSNALFRWISHT